MRRSVFIAVSVGVLLLALVGALRLTGEAPDEEMLARRDPRPAAGPDRRDGARAPDAVARTDRAARRLQGGKAEVVPERRRTARASGEGAPRAGSAPASASQPGVTGGAGIGGRRPRGIVDDDRAFRAAAEQLAEMEPARPTADDDEPTDEIVVPEPPVTPVVDDSMTYNSGDYRFSLDGPFQIPNTSAAGTVALWLQPEWSPDNKDDAALIELGDGLFRVYKEGDVLRFEVMADHPDHGASVSIAGWQPGEWHSLSATWQDQEVTFYVDGQPVGAPLRGTFAVQGRAPVTIGSLSPPDQAVAPGTISDVSLRTRVLAPDEISRLFERSAFTGRSR